MNFATRIAVLAVRGYQFLVSPWLGSRCRFEPSCSRYAVEALETHGMLRGGAMAARRLMRCHPWNPGGFDPVQKTSETASCGCAHH